MNPEKLLTRYNECRRLFDKREFVFIVLLNLYMRRSLSVNYYELRKKATSYVVLAKHKRGQNVFELIISDVSSINV